MLYMVEMELPQRSLLDEWHRWYDGHLRMLLTVPGFLTAQRFESTTPAASPFVAMYSLENAGVITSDAYRAKAGPGSTGKWRELMTNWNRNLLEGAVRAPAVPLDGWLAVMDRRSSSAPPLPSGFIALKPVGLDCSIVERGLLAGDRGTAPPAPQEADGWQLRVCRPLTSQLVPGGGGGAQHG